jgi:hypothetical protein
MAILKNCEIWFAKLDPKNPSRKMNPKNPTWEVQIRTTNKDQKKEWEGLRLKVAAVIPDEGAPYYKVNLKKKSLGFEKGQPVPTVPKDPPTVVGGQLQNLDPCSIGNGSVANVRIYQYDTVNPENGEKIYATMLMGMQVTKHIVYVMKPRDDDFEETESETIVPEPKEDDKNDFFKKDGPNKSGAEKNTLNMEDDIPF